MARDLILEQLKDESVIPVNIEEKADDFAIRELLKIRQKGLNVRCRCQV